MRYLLLAAVALAVGYAAGVIFGYRTAVVDYVENDARSLQKVAETMYEEDVKGPNEILREAVKEAEGEDDEPSGTTAFQ